MLPLVNQFKLPLRSLAGLLAIAKDASVELRWFYLRQPWDVGREERRHQRAVSVAVGWTLCSALVEINTKKKNNNIHFWTLLELDILWLLHVLKMKYLGIITICYFALAYARGKFFIFFKTPVCCHLLVIHLRLAVSFTNAVFGFLHNASPPVISIQNKK